MREVKKVKVGDYCLGDGNIRVQSMLCANAADLEGNVLQAIELEKAGCEILRVAIPSMEAVRLIPAIKDKISIPLVADIHFDHRLALACVDVGIDKIRINPGNIGGDENVRLVANACKAKGIPIRIGVNSGSVEKHILEKYGSPTAEAMVESALYHISLLEKYDFEDIVVSLKSTDVGINMSAYRRLASVCSYPLHLGVTEAGTERMGVIKSAVGIGGLLLDGIGETIRVSLTANPVLEVSAGFDILKAIGMNKRGAVMISCPTCGRTQIDLISLANQVEKRLEKTSKNIKVAVMGCVVNGPGEAKEADIGVAGGDGCGIIFKKGTIIKRVDEAQILDALMDEIDKL